VWRACGRDPPYACGLWVVLVGGALPVVSACGRGPPKKIKNKKRMALLRGPLVV